MKISVVIFCTLFASMSFARSSTPYEPQKYLKSLGLKFYSCQMGGPYAGDFGTGENMKRTATILAKSESDAVYKFVGDEATLQSNKKNGEVEMVDGTGAQRWAIQYLSCEPVQ